MDQVKKIFRVLMAQRFWILCGMVTLLPVGGWFTTTSTMRTVTEARKSAIKQKTDAAKALQAIQNHPNDESHKSMDLLRNKVTIEVGEAWRIQYERQKDLLVWPAGMGDDFLKVVNPLRPLEKVQPPATETDEVLKIDLRERYRNYIAEELPKLAKKIDAVWQVQEAVEGADANTGYQSGIPGGAAGTTPATGTPAVLEKVLWDPLDQTALRNRYDWSNRPKLVPRTIDVLYAQEDLWIMSALMDIIATTNQSASARYNAVVKEITYINLGREVGGSTGSVMRINAAAGGESGMMGGGMMGAGMMGAMGSAGMAGEGSGSGAGMTGGMMPGGGMMSGGGMMPGGMPGGADGGMGGMMGAEGAGAFTTTDPAENRYVDLNYQPVPAATLRTAITSDTQDPANAFLVVAKRIPIRLGLTVDQRKLNRFITACGNAPLMVEVRQVRFNRQGGSNAGAGGGMGGMGMGGMGMGGMGMGGMGMGGMGMGSGRGEGGDGGGAMPGGFGGGMGMPGGGFGGGMGMPGGGLGSGMPGGGSGYGAGTDTGMGPSDVSPHDKAVEIYGVVYLYNPVDVKKLGIENKEADGLTPPAAAPAVTAPGVTAPGVAAPGVAAPAVPANSEPATAPPADAATK